MHPNITPQCIWPEKVMHNLDVPWAMQNQSLHLWSIIATNKPLYGC